MKKKWFTALAACTIILAGCKIISESPIAVESITLNETTLTLAPGATRKLTATVTPDNADDKSVKWSSSNTAVAMVSSDGTIGAIKTGTTIITAQAGEKTAICVITVNDAAVTNPDSPVVNPDSPVVNPDTPVVNPDSPVVNPDTPVLNPDSPVENPDAPIAVDSITLSTTTLTIEPGKTRELKATVMPSNAEDKTITWSSSDEEIATVSDDGTITAHAEGIVTITARAGGKEATCTVTVKTILIAVERVSLNPTTLMLTRGETGKLAATVTPDNADDTSVAWSSSNTAIATVSDDGTVTAVNKGTATITAQAGDITAECAVTVNPILVASVTLDKTTLTLTRGEKGKLTAAVTPSNADDTTVAWSSSDTSVATVGNDGMVTANKAGTATITATTREGGKKATCAVTVNPILVASVALDKVTLTLTQGETGKLVATVTPNNADDKSVKWSSSDTAVATVGTDGMVTAVAKGTATITATTREGGKKAICVLTVTSPFVIEGGVLTKYVGVDSTVTIPAGVTQIGSEAFKGCTNLTGVTIPDSVTSIGDSAFSGCTNLKSVTIPSGVTSIGDRVFSGCTNLMDVVIPNSVTSIGKYAFSECQGLIVTIPDSVTSIDEYAFYRAGLNNMTIPDSVTSIGRGAFSGSYLWLLTIGNSVTSIGDSAFSGCKRLKSVTIPDSVTSIGDSAFSECTELSSVTIGNSVTSIGDCAFSGCRSLMGVTIGDSVTSIGDYAFNGCTNLMDVVIPDSVTSIGDEAFGGCTSLTSVKIPASVTGIRRAAFNKCTSLTSVTIPDGVTTIDAYVFFDCTSLKSVTIPASVTSIGGYAFSLCTELTTINYTGTKEQWNAITKGSYWDRYADNYTITYNYNE